MYPFLDTASDYSCSPTLFAPMPQPHFYPHDHIQSPTSNWMPASAPNSAPARPPPITKQSRKRSRDDIDDIEPSSLVNPENNGIASMEVIEEPVMGEGMTLIDPKTGRSQAPASQTGTWFEENLEIERKAAAEAAAALQQEAVDAQGRPSKTVRLDSPAPAMLDASPPQPLAATPAPAIDSASVMLGIGWKEVSSDADMQCAARGWTRYIENHYPILGAVEIFCKSEGLEAFLVKAVQPREGWWLFKEDLTEGRLVATTLEACIANLRTQPIAFEGTESLFAASSPATMSTLAEVPKQSPFEVAAPVAGVPATGHSDQMMYD